MYFLHTESTWIVENDDSMNWLSGMEQPNKKSESRVDTTMKNFTKNRGDYVIEI
jgi:hypothetical protein